VCAREKWPGWAWIWIIILQKYFLVYLFLALTHGVVSSILCYLYFIERVWSKSNLPFLFMNLIQFLLFYIQVPEHVNLKPISSLGFLYIFKQWLVFLQILPTLCLAFYRDSTSLLQPAFQNYGSVIRNWFLYSWIKFSYEWKIFFLWFPHTKLSEISVV
jgi:hypothetical protein